MTILPVAPFRPRRGRSSLAMLLLGMTMAASVMAAPQQRTSGEIASLLAERRVWTAELQQLREQDQVRIQALQAQLPATQGSPHHAEIQMEIEVVKHQSRLRYLEALEARAERAGNTALAAHVRTRIDLLRPFLFRGGASSGTVAR